MNILIPNTTKEEIEAIFEFARCGANNSMIGIHKEIIPITDEYYDKLFHMEHTTNREIKETIEIFQLMRSCYQGDLLSDFDKRMKQALDLAIKALEEMEGKTNDR